MRVWPADDRGGWWAAETHLTDAAHYGVTLLLATGSNAHLMSLRRIAAERNMNLDENGLRRGGKLYRSC